MKFHVFLMIITSVFFAGLSQSVAKASIEFYQCKFEPADGLVAEGMLADFRWSWVDGYHIKRMKVTTIGTCVDRIGWNWGGDAHICKAAKDSQGQALTCEATTIGKFISTGN
jgi:hypothetical protein